MMTKILVVDDEEDLKVLIKQRFRRKIRKKRSRPKKEKVSPEAWKGHSFSDSVSRDQ